MKKKKKSMEYKERAREGKTRTRRMNRCSGFSRVENHLRVFSVLCQVEWRGV